MTGHEAAQDAVRDEALDWLLKIEAAPEDPAVRADLAAWRARSPAHERAFRSVARAWRLAGDLPADYAEPARGAPQDGRPRTDLRPALRRSRRAGVAAPRRLRVPVALAGAVAACLVVLFAPALQLRLAADHATGTGERRAVMLDDGSRVHLDAESAIAVDYGPARRTVRLLAGRAYFEVVGRPHRPFDVLTDSLTVTVTGTAFAVDAGAAGTSVAVRSGSVTAAVGPDEGEVIPLGPGDRLTVAHGTGALSRGDVPPADVAAWREGRLVADGMRLGDLAARLDPYHRGVIWVHGADLADRRVTGVFNLDDPVAALGAAAATQSAVVTTLTPRLVLVTAP